MKASLPSPPPDLWPTVDLQRIDRNCNMARFWSAALQPTLFPEILLVRRWGRIGTRGQAKEYWFPDYHTALAALATVTAIKRRRGYAEVGRESPRRPEHASDPYTGAAA